MMNISRSFQINLIAVTFIVLLFICSPPSANSQDISFETEAGVLWFGKNDVRIPNEGGTDFDMIDLIGSDLVPYYRLRLNITFDDRHTIRLLAAPISKIGTGSLSQPVQFEETMFQADEPIDGTYRFNTYRITYRYTFYDRNNWTLGAGLTGLIRDAEVILDQPEQSDSKTDLGFVPLIHLYAQRGLGQQASLTFDGESLIGPQGRATDVSLTLAYSLTDNWSLYGGYRILEGGADVDDVYNFALINFGLIGFEVNL